MGARVVWAPALLALSLALGVGSAGGRTLALNTITVQVIGKGRVTSSGPEGLNCGDGETTCYLAFTAGGGTIRLTASDTAPGWTFNDWANDCEAAGSNNTCELPADTHVVTADFAGPPTPTSTLSVTFTGTGAVGATSGNPGVRPIDCGSQASACSWNVLQGSTVTVLEAPGDGYVFNGWSGACSGTGVACTVEMSGDRTVNASWSASSAAKLLTVTILGGGTVKGGAVSCPSTCSASEPLNSSVTLTATPDSGYTFTSWTGGCTGSGSTCTVTMTADTAVTATFSPVVTLTVSVSGNGNVSGGIGAINCGNGADVCSGTFAQNATVTLIATVATGATFAGWKGACGGTATTCTLLMSSPKSVSATFTGGTPGGPGATVPLSVSVSGNGTVTGGGISCGSGSTTCTANEALNATVVLSEAPGAGATFTGWSGACVGTTTTCTVVMATAKSVTATFTGGAATVQLSVAVSGRGSVKGGGISCGNGLSTCSANVSSGVQITLTATPATGATFSGWGGACSGKGTICTLIPTARTSVTATFSGGLTAGALTSLGLPLVTRSKTGFLVTLRFRARLAGTARVRGLRAGRAVTSLSLRVPAGNAMIGPFPVPKPGLFTFEIRLGSDVLRWRTCLGLCGAAAKAPPFVLTRETPVVTRAGVVWSVILRFRANAISDANIAVRRGGRLLANHHFLARAREIIVGPFLFGPGSYTLGLRAVDAYGRVRTLTWIVELAR